jgi:hypothetical protein
VLKACDYETSCAAERIFALQSADMAAEISVMADVLYAKHLELFTLSCLHISKLEGGTRSVRIASEGYPLLREFAKVQQVESNAVVSARHAAAREKFKRLCEDGAAE